jgi:hypothetical protein
MVQGRWNRWLIAVVRETKPKILVEEADFLGRREVLGGEGTELRWLGDGRARFNAPCDHQKLGGWCCMPRTRVW